MRSQEAGGGGWIYDPFGSAQDKLSVDYLLVWGRLERLKVKSQSAKLWNRLWRCCFYCGLLISVGWYLLGAEVL